MEFGVASQSQNILYSLDLNPIQLPSLQGRIYKVIFSVSSYYKKEVEQAKKKLITTHDLFCCEDVTSPRTPILHHCSERHELKLNTYCVTIKDIQSANGDQHQVQLS